MVVVIDTWEIAGVGCVTVESSDRARYTRLMLSRDGAIRLTVPRGIPLAQARRFLDSKLPWLRRHQQGFRALAQLPPVGRSGARRLLSDRVRELAKRHGFEVNRVFVKNQRTLWGSCSGRNNINLNIHLLRLPEGLRDYVILHELVHTRHKNHSPAFWRELDTMVGSGKRLQKQLRAFKLGA